MNDEIESRIKVLNKKHQKEVNELNNKLNKSLGQNRNLDDMLVQKETNFSSETKHKVTIKKLEMEVESLTESLRLMAKKGRGVTPKKKKKSTLESLDYDSQEPRTSKQMEAQQKLLEKEYAIEKLMTKVGQLELKNKELLKNQDPNRIVERQSSEEKSDKNRDSVNLNLN
jgi:hypothetical protein